ncbi:nitrate reductase molybdenum cofactor assembly chaperone [Escherichia coli]|uniref:nitrate reductase molybdenum cofactor assembly chaperone n=4 Tax=Enterobacteriaceae TaxID=543 RepID=UPI003AFFC99B
MQILKVIGLLMEYPDELLWECKEDALALIRSDAPMLTDFTHNLLNAPLLDKQAEWCEVFDRGRTTSLLLFEHVHAESRDRGQAMVDLLAEYEKVGLQLDCRELPDYLPLYLEYLSVLPDDQAKEGLLNVAPILALLGGRLKQREAPWYALFDALLQLAGSSLSSDSVTKQVNSEERDDTRQALDAVWDFRGGSSEMLNGVAFVFRLHLVLGMTIFLLFPFTRLVHVWSAPFEYFTRRYQIVRSRR